MKFHVYRTHYDRRSRDEDQIRKVSVDSETGQIRNAVRKKSKAERQKEKADGRNLVKVTINDQDVYVQKQIMACYDHRMKSTIVMNDRSEHNRLALELGWYSQGRPYYSVWPKIIPMMLKLRLDRVDASTVTIPKPYLNIRFPVVDNPFVFDWEGAPWTIRNIMLVNININTGARRRSIADLLVNENIECEDGIGVWFDIDECYDGEPVYTYRNFPRRKGMSVDEAIRTLPHEPFYDLGVQIPYEMQNDCIKLCTMLCLIDSGDELLTPDFGESARRAKKHHHNGWRGWHVGKDIDVSPHIRNPHPCLVWYGPGKRQSKIITRKGSLVRRDLAEKVPTGYDHDN